MSSGNCKYCPRCQIIKQKDQFYHNRRRSDGMDSYCKPCHLQYTKIRISEPAKREKQRKLCRDRYNRDPEVQKWSEVQRLYGLTKQMYFSMLSSQNGGCAICGGSELKKGRSYLSIDHCHKHGQVRGLLCDSCNWGLGNFKDDPDRLQRAISYLTKFRGAG